MISTDCMLARNAYTPLTSDYLIEMDRLEAAKCLEEERKLTPLYRTYVWPYIAVGTAAGIGIAYLDNRDAAYTAGSIGGGAWSGWIIGSLFFSISRVGAPEQHARTERLREKVSDLRSRLKSGVSESEEIQIKGCIEIFSKIIRKGYR